MAAAIERRARRHPILVAVDEAHTMPVSLGRTLLLTAQRLQRRGRPVQLLLAGTPDLPRLLNAMQTSFWDRSEALPIGRIGPEASAEAIRIPLERDARSIEPRALRAVVRESHGYPFFLQVWGKALWDSSFGSSRPISLSEVDRVRPVFQKRKYLYYGNRYDELHRAGLAPLAARVAALFADSEHRTFEDVHQAIAESLELQGLQADGPSVLESLERLRDLGYIWQAYDRPHPYFEPGIPSLMPYVARAAGSAGSETAPGR